MKRNIDNSIASFWGSSPDSLEQKIKRDQFASDHREALRAEKLGRKLAKKTIQMVEQRQTVRRIRSLYIFEGLVDKEDVTLALNGALKAQDIPVAARVIRRTNGSASDPDIRSFIELREVGGKPVETPEVPGWRKI